MECGVRRHGMVRWLTSYHSSSDWRACGRGRAEVLCSNQKEARPARPEEDNAPLLHRAIPGQSWAIIKCGPPRCCLHCVHGQRFAPKHACMLTAPTSPALKYGGFGPPSGRAPSFAFGGLAAVAALPVYHRHTRRGLAGTPKPPCRMPWCELHAGLRVPGGNTAPWTSIGRHTGTDQLPRCCTAVCHTSTYPHYSPASFALPPAMPHTPAPDLNDAARGSGLVTCRCSC